MTVRVIRIVFGNFDEKVFVIIISKLLTNEEQTKGGANKRNKNVTKTFRAHAHVHFVPFSPNDH